MNVHLICGAPGSGKTTLGESLCRHLDSVILEADQYFMVNGEYRFDRERLKHAHDYCQGEFLDHLRRGTATIAVCNTFTKQWERQFYIDRAKEYGANIYYHVCTGRHKNIHGVPDEVVQRMRQKFEPIQP